MALETIDWIIIVAYFLVTLAIGLAFYSRAGSSLSEYFVSGRSQPWWLAGTSMVATTFAADTPLAVTGLIAKHGLAGNWFWWAFALGGMFTVFVYARLWRRAEVMTDVEFVEVRYGGKPASALRTIRGLYFALVVNPIIIGWVTGAMLTVLKETVLHGQQEGGSFLTSDWGIILLSLAVVGVYSSLSGLWGVAVADFLQFFVAMAGCIALAWVAVQRVGGMEALEQKVAANFGDGGQAFGFLPDISSENAWMPWHVFLIFLLMQWWATWYPGAEPGGGGYIVQRMASCKDERHSILATLWFQFAHYCLRPWPWILVAYVALATYPEIRAWGLQGDAATMKPDVGYAWVIRDVCPPGLRGLMLVTFFAAFMSTISTQMNWGASYLICDVYQRMFRERPSDAHLTVASKWVSILVLVLGAIASYLMRNMPVDAAWKLLAALGAGTGAVYMLRWFWWRINAWSEIVAMLASLIYYLLLTRGLASLNASHAAGELADGSFLDWFRQFAAPTEVQTAIVAIPTILTWLLATFVTPPESEEVLLKFYRQVRPGGPGWKPLARLAPEVQVDRNLGASILASVLGAAVIYLTLPAIGWLLFGRYLQAGVALAAAAACGVATYQLMKRMGWNQVVS